MSDRDDREIKKVKMTTPGTHNQFRKSCFFKVKIPRSPNVKLRVHAKALKASYTRKRLESFGKSDAISFYIKLSFDLFIKTLKNNLFIKKSSKCG